MLVIDLYRVTAITADAGAIHSLDWGVSGLRPLFPPVSVSHRGGPGFSQVAAQLNASALHLVEAAGLTPPDGVVVGVVTPARGIEVRTAFWAAPDDRPVRGTVLVCTGRSEFIEKYYETVRELRSRGFAAVVFDWRGQGRSTRALRNRRKGHIASFDQYLDDLAAVVGEVLDPKLPAPHFALAHSMGGAVMALHAASPNCAFDRIVLSAPMVEVHNLPFPRYLNGITSSLSHLGFGGLFVPQGQRAAVFDRGFEGNVLTSDPQRFAAMMAFAKAAPDLALGAPTIGWLYAAFRAMNDLNDRDICRAIRTPTLVVVPGADRVVSVPAMERFVQRLKSATLVRVPYARHEILMERDALRSQFWAAFDAFIPGEAVAPLLRREA